MRDIRILYVEDEPALGKIVKDSLESRNYDVKLVSDGAHVITQFHKFNPHICVLDVMLPNKDGFTLGEEIRSLDEKVPIIFLTAKTQTQDLLNGFHSGGNDYIKKPFSMEELIVRIYDFALKVDCNKIKSRDLDDVRPGGLGVHLIHKVMDSVNYQNINDDFGNMLELRKVISDKKFCTLKLKDENHEIPNT